MCAFVRVFWFEENIDIGFCAGVAHIPHFRKIIEAIKATRRNEEAYFNIDWAGKESFLLPYAVEAICRQRKYWQAQTIIMATGVASIYNYQVAKQSLSCSEIVVRYR